MTEPAYPLPWRIEEDWTYELTAANDAVLAKFPYPRGEWRSLAEAVVAAANLLGWRPIETYKKIDGPAVRAELVDLFFPGEARWTNCFWNHGTWWQLGTNGRGPLALHGEPTHWMPLPNNPEVER